jgi:membrane-associated protease RseP (regulator of RpoE activity)
MERRVGIYFVTTVLSFFVLTACGTRTAPIEDDETAAISVVLAHEHAVQAYDFDKVDSLHMPDARVIEEGSPHPFEPDERQAWRLYKDAGIHVEYHPRDAVADVRDNVAWVTVTLPSDWRADTAAGRAILGASEWRATYVETFILVKTPAGWKIDFRHTTILPPDFGVEPDYQQERGGMKFAKVPENGPAGKAGLKSGDVLIAYGGQKIDNPDDLYRLRYAHYEGEKVMVTVMRGPERITKEVTLEQMR